MLTLGGQPGAAATNARRYDKRGTITNVRCSIAPIDTASAAERHTLFRRVYNASDAGAFPAGAFPARILR